MGIVSYSVAFAAICVLYYSFYKNNQTPIPKMPEGFAAPGWERVKETFRKQVESGWQGGGALSVYHKGELVVDVYGGYADEAILLEWASNTLTQIYSTTKAMGAIVMAMLVERGLIDYSKPVSNYWPEFAQNGKQDITVEQLLGHQAGVAGLDEPFEMLDILHDQDKMHRILAAQKPLWKPGTASGYHALTLGLYEDQLVRKVDPKRRSLSQFFREEIAIPYNIDMFIGLPKEENYRCARIVKGKLHTVYDYLMKYVLIPVGMTYALSDRDSLLVKVLSNPKNGFIIDKYYNHPSWREVPLVATSGFTTATGLAKVFGILASGKNSKVKPIINENLVKLLQQPLENDKGTEIVFGANMTFGRGVSVWRSPLGSNTFGAPGGGGQMGICDPGMQMGIAYVTSHSSVDDDTDDKYYELERVIYETVKNIK